MLFADLKTNLSTQVKPAYFLFGADTYLINKAVELIIGAVKSKDVTKLDESASSDEIVIACRTVSFFGTKRVIISRGGQYDCAEITKYLLSPNSDCCLILVVETMPKLKNIEAVDCNPMTAELTVKLIANQINSFNKKITVEAAKLLTEFCGNNYARINNEVLKLVNFYNAKDVLSAEEIKAIASKTEEYQVYELGNAVLRRETEKAERILVNLTASGTDEYMIFASLVSLLRRVWYSLTTKAPAEDVAMVLKCNPYAVTASRRDFKNFSAKIPDMYSKALELEYQIKSGRVMVSSATDLLMMVCCGQS